MFKNKKAFVLKEAIVLGFAAVLLIFGSFLAYKIYTFFSSESDDGSLSNFEYRLVPKVQELLKNDNKLDYTQINYFIGDAAVVGYNKVWDSQQNLEIIGAKIEKPSSCSNKACLCFFRKNTVLSANPDKPCIKLDKVAYFLKEPNLFSGLTPSITSPGTDFYSSQLPETFTNEGYKYLLLSGSTLKVKNQAIYIEKYTNSKGDVTFYLAPVNDDTKYKINERKAYIDSLTSK